MTTNRQIARQAADDILKRFFGIEITKAGGTPNPLTPRGFDAFVLDVLDAIKKEVSGPEAEAMKAMLQKLQRQWGALTPAERKAAIDDAAKKYLTVTRNLAPRVGKVLQGQGDYLATATKIAADKKFKLRIEPSLNLPDRAAIDFLAKSQANYVRNQFGVRAVRLSQVARDVVAQGLEEGLDRYEIGDRLDKALKDTDAARARSYYRMIASVFVARARTFSTLSGFHEAGIGSFQFEAVLDEVTTEMCRFLHGRVFPVVGALARIHAVETSPDPEAVAELQPWASLGKADDGAGGTQQFLYFKQGGQKKMIATVDEPGFGEQDKIGKYGNAMNNRQIAEAGMSTPPLHGHCRSLLVPVYGGAETSVPEPQPTPPQAPQAPLPYTPPPPNKLPENLAELVRPLPTMVENPDVLPPPPAAPVLNAEQQAVKDAYEKLKNLPPAVDWSSNYVMAPGIAPAPSNPTTGKIELPFGKLNHMHAVNILKKPPVEVPLGHIIHTAEKAPMVNRTSLDEWISDEALKVSGVEPNNTPPKIVLGKYQGNYYLMNAPKESTAKPTVYLGAQKLLGKETVQAHVIDIDAFLAKPKVPPKPKVPKVEAPPPASPVVLPETSKPKAIGSSENILHEKVGEQRGSNQGGFYTGKDGVKRYVKFYEDESQAYCENLANSVYRDLGHEAPDSELFERKETGKIQYASKVFEGAQTLGQAGLTKERAQEFMKGFVGDVLTGNWDAAGTGLDNAMVLPNGKILRVDNGGSFLFRAQAARRKPDALLNDITEWNVFFSNKNPHYQRVAQAAGWGSPEDFAPLIKSEVAKVTALRDKAGGWAAYVDARTQGLGATDRKKMIDMLEARTKLLEERVADFGRPKPKSGDIVQFSTVAPHKGLTVRDLPSHGLYQKLYDEHRQAELSGKMPDGEGHGSYLARSAKRLEAASADARAGVRAFTGSSYGSIRASEEKGEPNHYAKGIAKAFDRVEGDVREVYRGVTIHDNPKAALEFYLRNETWGLGREGKGATSSASWAAHKAWGGNNDPGSGGLHIIYKIKNKTGIAVEPISNHPHEREVLLGAHARYRTTGLSFKTGSSDRVLYVEAEEI